jgi:hypothetical protein
MPRKWGKADYDDDYDDYEEDYDYEEEEEVAPAAVQPAHTSVASAGEIEKYQTSTFQADVILGWRRGACEHHGHTSVLHSLMSFLVPTAKLHSPYCILGKLWNTCKDVDFVQNGAIEDSRRVEDCRTQNFVR